MNPKMLSFYGLKFHPFRPDVPVDALWVSPAVDCFCRRVEFGLGDGGFVTVTGEPGSGKSVTLRVLTHRLRNQRDVVVGTLEHPQSRLGDFYREMGEVFGVSFPSHSRWHGFKALRSRWAEHMASTLTKPVLIVDEAQDVLSTVFTELRVLSSKDLDSRSLLTIVLSGDSRLPERFRSDDLLPIGSRIRRRLVLDYANREELTAALDCLLAAAGNPSLMTTELRATLAEHAAGNYRVLMNMADELLNAGAERSLPQLDEKLFLEIYTPPAKQKVSGKKR